MTKYFVIKIIHYFFIIVNKIGAFPDFLLNDVVILYVIFLLLSTFYRLIYLLRREGRCENENSPLSFLFKTAQSCETRLFFYKVSYSQPP